jgi:hypothetical protein
MTSGRKRNQFCRVFAHGEEIALTRSGVDPQIATLGPAQALQFLQERGDAGFGL